MAQVSVRAARKRLRELIDLARSGEDVTILRHGRPVARIVGERSPPEPFPDFTDFRRTIVLRDDAMNDVVDVMRRDGRY
jgi:prevent-host-death family protein